MSLTNAFHESLPYIDQEPTPSETAAATALIAAELPPSATQTPHPSLPAPSTPQFSDLFLSELERVRRGDALEAIDLTRYEAQEPLAEPSATPQAAAAPAGEGRSVRRSTRNSKSTTSKTTSTTPRSSTSTSTPTSTSTATTTTTTTTTTSPSKTQQALQKAYTSHAYLTAREANLTLLDAHGKNAWLIANWQLEADLKRLETELAARRADIDRLTVERRRAQEEVAGEMKGLDESWKKGVARTLETEVAAEGLKRDIREVMRMRGQ